MKTTGKPIAAGILNIITGVFSLISFLSIIIAIINFSNFPHVPFTGLWFYYDLYSTGYTVAMSTLVIIAIILAVMTVLPLVGGIYALIRKKWGLALTGSIIALLPFNPLGLASLILVALSREEFE